MSGKGLRRPLFGYETFKNVLNLSKEISKYVSKGDRCLIISENRPEWQIADLAIMTIGAISVPAYTTSTSNDYKHIINHSGARCLIVSSHDLTILESFPSKPSPMFITNFSIYELIYLFLNHSPLFLFQPKGFNGFLSLVQ